MPSEPNLASRLWRKSTVDTTSTNTLVGQSQRSTEEHVLYVKPRQPHHEHEPFNEEDNPKLKLDRIEGN
jgi:hypothetical protein